MREGLLTPRCQQFLMMACFHAWCGSCSNGKGLIIIRLCQHHVVDVECGQHVVILHFLRVTIEKVKRNSEVSFNHTYLSQYMQNIKSSCNQLKILMKYLTFFFFLDTKFLKSGVYFILNTFQFEHEIFIGNARSPFRLHKIYS